MASPSDEAPRTSPAEGIASSVDARLVHLRLLARVAVSERRVRLVGGGPAVEITRHVASTARTHNELVTVELDEVCGVAVEQAERLLHRWQALDQRVHVDVVTLRTASGRTLPGRRIELTGPDGAVLRWQERGAIDAERAAVNRSDGRIG